MKPDLEFIRIYIKERDEAVASMDVEKFRKFAEKYNSRVQYVNDEVVEVMMRKMAVHITSLPVDVRTEAFRWLISRGYDFDLE